MENIVKDPSEQQTSTLNTTRESRISQHNKENSAADSCFNPARGPGNKPRYIISLRNGSKTAVGIANERPNDLSGSVKLFKNAMISNKIAEDEALHHADLAPCIREEDGEASPEKPGLHPIYSTLFTHI